MNRSYLKGRTCVLLAALCTMAALAETPDTFTWTGSSGDDWHETGVWSAASSGRTTPGIVGDTIVVPAATAIALNSDATVSGANFSGSGGTYAIASDGAAATLTLEAATAGGTVQINALAGRVNLGAPPTDGLITVRLQDAVRFKRSTNTGNSLLALGAKLTGGSDSDPSNLVVEEPGQWANTRIALMNSANTFRGDLVVGGGGTANGTAQLFIGYDTLNAHDGMLGDPANRVILDKRSGTCALVIKGGVSAFGRTVIGRGTIRGGYVDSWGTLQHQKLILGEGCSIEPCAGHDTAGVGSITIQGSVLEMHPAAQIVFSVGSGVNDTVTITMANTVTTIPFTGRIAIDELSAISVGTSFNLITVAANPAGFSFSPSEVPTDYTFKVVGNAVDGWVVSATKIDPNAPALQNLPTTLIGESDAVVNTGIVILGDATALKVYYGTADGGTTAAGWGGQAAVYPAVPTEPGTYSLNITGLDVNQTYFVRHAIVANATEYFTLDVESFTTRPLTTPDTYTWVATNNEWFAEGVWTVDTPYKRLFPEHAGDTVIFRMGGAAWNVNGISRTVNIDRDVSVGRVTVYDGTSSTLRFCATNAPATLAFDSGDGSASRIQSNAFLASLALGTASDQLAVELRNPLVLNRNGNFSFNAVVYAPISGGDESNLCDLVLDTTANEYTHVYFYLLNPDNTFRGDVYVGADGSYGATTRLNLGARRFIGSAAVDYPSENAMCGDPANRIIMRNKATVRVCAAAGSAAPFERVLLGGGRLEAVNRRDEWNDDLCAMYLSPTARIQPSGTITVAAASLIADAGTEYAFTASEANGISGLIAFSVNEPLALTGTVLLADAEGEDVADGTSFDIMTVAASAQSFVSQLTKIGPYKLTTTGDATSGWTVTATKSATGTLLMIR